MHFNLRALLGAYLAATALASPTPSELQKRDPITNLDQLNSAISQLRSGNSSPSQADSQALYERIQPSSSPSSIADAIAGVKTITDANPGDIFRSGAEIILGGFAGGPYANIINGYLFTGSSNNFNPRPAFPPVYPKADIRDAPYSISEAKLRAAIYIPPNFTYGKKQPLIFLPGTGVRSGPSFASNMGKLFTNNPLADPVYVNVPKENLDDIQLAAEYAAYAVNYISAISGHRKVSFQFPDVLMRSRGEADQRLQVSTLSWSMGSM
jgi:hypothetical protein